MKWTKVSDQIPEKSLWPELHYQVDYAKADGVLMDSEEAGIVWFEKRINGGYKDIEDLSRVEWLDESTPISPSSVETVTDKERDTWADDPRTDAVYEGAKEWENQYEQAVYTNKQIFDVIKKSIVNADDELSRLENMEAEKHWTQSHKNLSMETRVERKILEKLLVNLSPLSIHTT